MLYVAAMRPIALVWTRTGSGPRALLCDIGASVNHVCIGFALCLLVCGCRASPHRHSSSEQNPCASSPTATQNAGSPDQSEAEPRFERGTQRAVACPTSTPTVVLADNLLDPAQNQTAQPNVTGVHLAMHQSPSSAEAVPAPSPDNDQSSWRLAPNVLSLSDALALGLSENPDLITLRGTASVGAAAVDVAGVYPWNPYVQAQYLPTGRPFTPGAPGDASGQGNYYILAMHRFELAHQRRHREDSAIAALGQIRWNIEQAELLNVAQTERLFFTAVYRRQLRDLAAEAERLSDRLAGIVERRFKAALATNVDNINAQMARRQSRRQRELADAVSQAAKLALLQHIAMATSSEFDLSGDLSQYEWFSVTDAIGRLTGYEINDPQLLAQETAEARPDVLASRSAIATARANLRLARAGRVPDIQAGPIYETADDGTKFLGVRLQRDFGIFNNGSALVRQRLTEVQQQRLTFEQLRRRAANEALTAIERYERARQLAAHAALELPTNPRLELEQALREFEAGNAQILDVVAVQNNLLQETRSYIDLLNEVAQAAAQVTQATAIPPERLLSWQPPRFVESEPR